MIRWIKNKIKNREKPRFSKAIVTLVVLLNTLFAISVLYIFYKIESEPVTLIGAWFAFTTGELFLLSKIKRDEIKEGDKNED